METGKIMKALKITDLHVQTLDGKKILNGVNLEIKTGEIHAIMGPNGGGKSTFSQVLMGHPGYVVTQGTIVIDGIDITSLSPDQRAKHGLFLGFQYPVEVAGVNFANYLRLAMNEQRKEHEKKISPIAFRKLLAEKAQPLMFNEDIAKRMLNEGFSGGEKKKSEILQLAILQPDFAILDEPDSGLDIDALRYIANSINAMKSSLGLILITHYQRILRYINPQFVHIMIKGKLVESGSGNLAKEIEEKGYENYIQSN